MNRLVEQIQSGDFDPAKELSGNKEKFLEVKTAFESISNKLSKEESAKLVLHKLIPFIFNKSMDNVSRDRATEIGSNLLESVNIFVLSNKEQEQVLNSIEETYIKTIGEFRDSNYPNWDKLWIFLIKFCSYKIHSKMSLANKLLRVVEVAFRNSTSIEQRLKAYDCWSELINNSSLNMDHMCSAKQIKLLMTPMKAKFSRMPVVIMKRCDTFVYLLEKLQDKATLCLKEFLEFCFGPFDEKNDGKMKQGRSVSDVCNKSTKVLIEILGHSHEESEPCLINDDLNLYKPLITDDNFPNFSEILINSVIECYVLLNEWSPDLQNNNTIIKCLWRSLLQFIHDSNDDVKKKCRSQINSSLKNLLERSRSNDSLHVVLGNMINLLIKDEMADNLKATIFDVSLDLLHHLIDCSINLEDMQNFLISCFDPENGSNFDKIACSSFKTNMKCVNPALCEIWLKCKITIVPDNISSLVWPVRHFRNFPDDEAVKTKWTKIYTSECKTDSMKFAVMKEMEKLFLENPLISSNIVGFLVLISAGETNPGRDFVSKFMRLIELVLSLPNLSDHDVHKIGSLVLSYCNQNQHFYKSENIEEAMDKLCGCLERLVTIHKDYRILMELPSRLKNTDPKNLAKFSKRLMSFLESTMLNEDNRTANHTRKLIELLETKQTEPETTSSSSRSLRIINMANASKSKRLSVHKSSPFSSTISSPRNKIWGSDKKKKDVVGISQDDSADYVKVDTEVKINIENLSEHQKEMFKKRREDIPALYQDLTQSQSQDIFKSMHNEPETEPEKSTKKRKRSDQDENEDVSKNCKISKFSEEDEDVGNAETQTQISTVLDTDFTQIFDEIPLEPVQKEPPEELFQETPIRPSPTKISATLEPEMDDQKPAVEKHTEKIKEDKGKENGTDLPKSEAPPRKVKSPEKPESPSRRSPRNATKKSENNVAKELDTLLDNVLNKKPEEEAETEEKKSTRVNHTTVVENGIDHENDTEKEDKKKDEVKLRKSARQVKKRNSDFMFTLRTKKVPEGKVKANRSMISQSSGDMLESESNEKNEDEEKAVANKKKNKEKRQQNDDEGDSEESISELLARVDKRIEENLRLQKQKDDDSMTNWKFQDGNQNKIMSLDENNIEFASNQEEVKEKIERKSPVPKSKNVVPPPCSVSPSVVEENPPEAPKTDDIDDLYEFKAEKVSSEEIKKKRNRKKGGMSFNRSDYCKKRKRKPNKDKKEKGFEFHVTADSPVPLSRSPSLRAVPSSDKSETITILITRSPPEAKENQEDARIDEGGTTSTTPTSPKRRSKRKLSPSKSNSEDLIESSQVPIMDTYKRRSRDRQRALKQTTIDEIMKPVEPAETKKDEDMGSTTKNEDLDISSTTKNEDRSTTDKDEDRISDTTTVTAELSSEKENDGSWTVSTGSPKARRSSFSGPSQKVSSLKRLKRSKSLDKIHFTSENITFSVPPKDKENHVSDSLPDTLTCSTVNTESKDTLSMETEKVDNSPVAPDTSTTKDDLPGSPITCDTPDRTTEFLNNTSDISPISSVVEDNVPTPKPPKEVSNMRVARLIQMVNSNVQVSNEGRRWFGTKHSSPRSSKVRKMRVRKEEDLDILTFSREVPSPLTVPTSGILKRKFGNLDEAPTPSPKRKRVNFSDPAITEKKIFIKDFNEYTDANHKTASTNFSETLNTDSDEKDGAFSREEALVSFRDFCDSSCKNSCEFRERLEILRPNLKVPELEAVVSEYLDSQVNDEAQQESSSDTFLPKLLSVVAKLQDEHLKDFVNEITKVVKGTTNDVPDPELTQQQVEDYVVRLDCDKMNDLIKTYFSSLQLKERNDFLLNLMSLASGELPVTKEFIKSHFDIVQTFVSKMDE